MTLLDPNDAKHAGAQDRLRAEVIAWLTTAGADGQPQSTPVWFVWDGDAFLIYSRDGSKKLANIASNPKVSIHLEGDRVGGDNVIFEGKAERLPDAPAANDAPTYIEKYRPRIEQYGWTADSFANDYPHAIRVTPTRVRIW